MGASPANSPVTPFDPLRDAKGRAYGSRTAVDDAAAYAADPTLYGKRVANEVAFRTKLVNNPTPGNGHDVAGFFDMGLDAGDIAIRDVQSGVMTRARRGSTGSSLMFDQPMKGF